jgi:hypothetical protein
MRLKNSLKAMVLRKVILYHTSDHGLHDKNQFLNVVHQKRA